MNYPEDFINKIICGDCLDVMKGIPGNGIDLIITSPPYDDLRDYNGYDFDYMATLSAIYRVLKPGGIAIWVVGDKTHKGTETGTSFKHALHAKDIVGFNLHDTMIYEKSGMGYPDSTRYHQIFEYMFVFSKGKPKTVNLIKDRKNKWVGLTGGNKRGGLCNRKEYGARFNVWRYANGRDNSTKDRIAFKHPAIFPEGLAKDHIISWSNPGDTVLDPMCGSGTTCKSAKLLNRNFIGIDISEEYCEIARERLSE